MTRAPERAIALVLVVALCLLVSAAQSRDRGQFAGSSPELHQWFEGLKSGVGFCCADADGVVLADVDWDSVGTHYRVRIDGQWIVVPDEAVLHGPNLAQRTMVWPNYIDGRATIRCFMPGSMM